MVVTITFHQYPSSILYQALKDDQNGQNRHQHLKDVTTRFRFQQPSPTSVLPM